MSLLDDSIARLDAAITRVETIVPQIVAPADPTPAIDAATARVSTLGDTLGALLPPPSPAVQATDGTAS